MELLDNIIQAIRERNVIMSLHYWEKLAHGARRPSKSAIIASIGNNVPEILEDYSDNPRGASCLILGMNGQGGQIHSVVGYGSGPIRIITAYHPNADKWINGRRRK